MLSQRGRINAHSTILDGYKREKNNYEKDSNPNGVVSFSDAENFLMHQYVSTFVNKGLSIDQASLTYNEGPIGNLRLRSAMATHMNATFHPHKDVTEEHVTFATGVTALNEACAINLADEGEALLLGMPIYGSFYHDLTMTTKCKIVYAPFRGIDQFSVGAATQYEHALLDAATKGIKIKALMICNPHNLLGSCYTIACLKELFIFCEKYQLHLISDEVYALSVFEASGTQFTSVLSVDPTGLLNSDRIHVLYGLSKDFGAAGLRLGCLVTYNKQLSNATRNIGRFHWPSELSCAIAIKILEDRSFTTEYIGKSHMLLNEQYILATQILKRAGISYYDRGNSGFFLWIDLSPFLEIQDRDNKDLWEAENMLSSELLKAGVEMSAGFAYHNEKPGWFRVIFSDEREVLEEGLRR
ncbi:hypothetical protein EAE96_009171 [Botrytis aclada]|nr:hypothetical protein EAE96_009171 [Botrytis aclada]